MTVDYTRPPMPPPPPPPAGTPGVPPPQGKTNWSGCLKGCAIGCGILVIIAAVGIAGLVLFVFKAIKSSDVYTGALHRAQNDPRVIAALGTPIEDEWWVFGNVNINNDHGTANITIPIHGPKGKARIECEADRDNNSWRYTRLVVKGAGDPIDLLNAPAGQNVRIQPLEARDPQVFRESVHDM